MNTKEELKRLEKEFITNKKIIPKSQTKILKNKTIDAFNNFVTQRENLDRHIKEGIEKAQIPSTKKIDEVVEIVQLLQEEGIPKPLTQEFIEDTFFRIYYLLNRKDMIPDEYVKGMRTSR